MVEILHYVYNIRNGMYGEIESALWAIVQANMVLWVLYKTNITGGVYTYSSLDYNVSHNCVL